MKRFLFFVLIMIVAKVAIAQLEVKEGSFKKVDGFVNINTEKMFDDNDKPYAVLKIRTENINDKQRRELSFGGDAQTFFETEYKDGEVWLYISYYATFLKISHLDLSSTEYWFPYDMEPKCGYEITLVNKPAVDEEKIISLIDKRLSNFSNNTNNEYGYIMIKTTPVEGAIVYIDGQEMEMKTPYISNPITQGPHKITVKKEGFMEYVDLITIKSGQVERLDIDLTYNPSSFSVQNDLITQTLTFSRFSPSKIKCNNQKITKTEAKKILGQPSYNDLEKYLSRRKTINIVCFPIEAISCCAFMSIATMPASATETTTTSIIGYSGVFVFATTLITHINLLHINKNKIIKIIEKHNKSDISFSFAPAPDGIKISLIF